MTEEDLRKLLDIAHTVITWTTQGVLEPGTAATPHLVQARHDS